MTTRTYIAEPTPAKFHAQDNFVRGIMGPIGCLAGDTLVVTAQGLQRIESLTYPTHVLSWDAKMGQFRFVLASASFPKGKDVLYQVLTPHGEWRAAGHHRVFCADSKYRQVQELAQQDSFFELGYCDDRKLKNSLQNQLLSIEDDRHWWKIGASLMDRCGSLFRLYGQQLLFEAVGGQGFLPLQTDVPIGESDRSAKEHIHQGPPFSLHARKDYLRRWAGRLGALPRVVSRFVWHILPNILKNRQYEWNVDEPSKECEILNQSYLYSLSERPILSIKRLINQEVYWDIHVPGTNNYVTADGTIHHNSGKSVACVIEIISRAMRQAPDQNGQRRTRWAVIRNTYPELTSTTIKTWMDWLPVSQCPIVYSSPITGRFKAPMKDGTVLDAEILFLALDLPKDVKKLLSLELTGAWVNEARELDKIIIDTVTSRVGRFPAKMDGGPTWSGVIMDTNPPDDSHWWYKMAENDRPDGWTFWRQPPALIDRGGEKYEVNPAAENLNHQPLGGNYWLRQVGGKTKEWIKVYLLGEYGTVMAGKPIYAGAWSDSMHVAEVKPLAKHEILCGWDWGLTPACVVAQVTPRGQLIILDEVIGEDTGVRQFAEGFVIPLLQTKYRDCPQTHIGDPAGNQRAQADERTVFEELARLGIRVIPAPSNSPLARWEAVRHYLTRMTDGKPGFALSPSCKMLRKGFNGGYRFRQLQVSGETRYSDQADKNAFSHCHDGLAYLAQWLHEPSRQPTPRFERPVAIYDAVAGY